MILLKPVRGIPENKGFNGAGFYFFETEKLHTAFLQNPD